MSDETHNFTIKDGGVYDFRMQTALWLLIFDLQSRGYAVMRIAWPNGGYALVVTKPSGDGSEAPSVSEEEPYGGADDELRALRAVVARIEPELLRMQSEVGE